MQLGRETKLALAVVSGVTVAGCNAALWSGWDFEHTGGAGPTSSSSGTGAGGTHDGGGGTGGGGSTGGEVVWAHTYSVAGDAGGSAGDGGLSPEPAVAAIAIDSTGNVYIAGSFSGTMAFPAPCSTLQAGTSTEGFVLKLGPDGSCLKVLVVAANGSNADAKLTALTLDGDDRVVVAGTFSNMITLPGNQWTTGNEDAFVVSYHQNLDPSSGWSGRITGTGKEVVTGLAASGGHVYIVGSSPTLPTAEFGSSSNDLGSSFVLDVDAMSGAFSSQRTLSATASITPEGVSADFVADAGADAGYLAVAGTSAGDVTVASNSKDGGGGEDAFFVSFPSSLGGLPALAVYGDAADQHGKAVAVHNGSAYLAGQFHAKLSNVLSPAPQSGSGKFDVFLAKLDLASLATSVTAAHLVTLQNSDANTTAVGGVAASDDDVVIAGGVASAGALTVDGQAKLQLSNKGSLDIYAIKLEPDFHVKWAKTFGTAGSQQAADAVAIGPAGAVYIAGHFTGGTHIDPKMPATGDGIFVAQLKP